MNLPRLRFEGPATDALNRRGRGEVVSLFWILLFPPAVASVADLFSRQICGDRRDAGDICLRSGGW